MAPGEGPSTLARVTGLSPRQSRLFTMISAGGELGHSVEFLQRHLKPEAVAADLAHLAGLGLIENGLATQDNPDNNKRVFTPEPSGPRVRIRQDVAAELSPKT